MANKTASRLFVLLVVVVVILLITTLTMLISSSDMLDEPDHRAPRTRTNTKFKKEMEEEGGGGMKGRVAEVVPVQGGVLDQASAQCLKEPSQNYFRQANEKVKRYILTQTQDDTQEAYHPSLRFIDEADTAMGTGVRMCNWGMCGHDCLEASYHYGILLLKLQKYNEVIGTLQNARNNFKDTQLDPAKTATTNILLAKLTMLEGFTNEWEGNIDLAEDLHAAAKELWPGIEKEYLGILRVKIPESAPRDEKMKIYFYGSNEQIVALLELLIDKEFYSEDLRDFPVLSDDEPEQFWRDRNSEFKLIKQLMSPFVQRVFARMANDLIERKALPFGDGQSQRYYMYNERAIRFFHINTIHIIEKIVGKTLIPSYVYFGAYVAGAILDPHQDRPVCEFTLSLLIDQSPPGSVWRLGIRRESKKINPNFPGGSAPLPAEKDTFWGSDQHPGDGFLILGRQKVHFRDGALPEGWFTRAYFLHYVYPDFTGSLT